MNNYPYDRQAICEQISIVDHISKHETLRKENSGRQIGSHNHDSKGNRCLQVYTKDQTFYCHHCQVGGDVVVYEAERLGVSRTQAIERLIEEYKLDIPNETPEQREARIQSIAERVPVQELMLEAFKLYHTKMNEDQRNYYLSRGLQTQTIDQNLLGYAPKGGRWLVEQLQEKVEKPDKEQFLKTGLFFQNSDGKLRDRYVDRYVMPYWFHGKIVFSIGRAASEKVELNKKYVKHLVKGENYPFVSEEAVQHILWNEEEIRNHGKILVAEGIIDALLAKQEFGQDYCVVSPVTVAWTNAQIHRLSEKTARVKEITFVGDAEDSGAGEAGAYRTANKIMGTWNDLAETTPEIFNQKPNPDAKASSKAPETIPYFPQLKIARLRRPPELSKIDLADYVTANKTKELRYWIEASKTIEYEQQRMAGNPRRFFIMSKPGGYVAKRMADEIRLDGQFFMYTADTLYRYRQGVYLTDGEQYLAQRTQELLGDYTTSARRNETLAFMAVDEYIEAEDHVNIDTDTLNLKNGLFSVESGEIKPHTPDYKSTTRIPVSYRKDAAHPIDRDGNIKQRQVQHIDGGFVYTPKLTEHGKIIKRFVSSIVPFDCEDLIYEIAGNCLIPDRQHEKTFMLLGEGSNGKSTLIHLITELLGQDNVSHIPLQELDENRFARADMYGKLANLFADLEDSDIQNSKYFKMATSGDAMRGERKNQHGFNFKPHATMIFSANNPPKSKDTSHGFYRRWEFIPFPNKFEDKAKDTGIKERITSEECLEAFLYMAIEGLRRVKEKGEYSTSETTKEVMANYKATNDSVHAFAVDHIEESTDNVIHKRTLYNMYAGYCKNNGVPPEKSHEFNKRLQRSLPFVESMRDNDKKRTYGWRHIIVTGDVEPIEVDNNAEVTF